MYSTIPYEIGPIRPPSESDSLLVRVTRGCSWNRCGFCKSYQGQQYGQRPVREIVEGIQVYAPQLQEERGRLFTSAFIQDADPIAIPTKDLAYILTKLKGNFSAIARITTYARSTSLVKKSPAEMKELHEAGLTRIHRGVESGYDPLLRYMQKGATAESHIEAGKRVKDSGIELSDYVMPGLGGNLFLENQPAWKNHALETARVINEVNPDYIRLRTLVICPKTALWDKSKHEGFLRLFDQDIAREISIFIENLTEITSQIESDHKSNVLLELNGKLPQDKDKMLALVDRYLSMKPIEQYSFRIGALLGGPATLDEFKNNGGIQQAFDRLGSMLGRQIKLNLNAFEENERANLRLEDVVQGLMTGII